MLTLILLIAIAICITLISYAIKTDTIEDDTIGGLIFLNGLVIFILLIVVLVCTYNYYTTTILADQQIKLYTEQNNDIENKVALVVDKYLKHEKDTYATLKPKTKITLASTYPELQSNKLVQQQIQLYNENNKKITKCKLQKIKAQFYRKLIVPFSWGKNLHCTQLSTINILIFNTKGV